MPDGADGIDWLARLEDWYELNCNGDWEHNHSIKIDTLDNPGWRIRVDIEGTLAEGRVLERIIEEVPQGWMHYWSDGVALEAACSPRYLGVTIKAIVNWLAFFQSADGSDS